MDIKMIAIAGLVCNVLGLIAFSVTGKAPANTAVPSALPSVQPSIAASAMPSQAPSAVPSVAAPSPVPSPSPVQIGIDDVGPAVNTQANLVLSAKNAAKPIDVAKLEHNTGPIASAARTYYQGQINTVVDYNGTRMPVTLAITVFDLFKGEPNMYPVSASSTLTIDGRNVDVSGSPDDFRAEVTCIDNPDKKVYIYADEKGKAITALELFTALVKACPQ
jgi:hypothetical protein